MASETELDVLIEKAIETLNGSGEKVNSNSIIKLVRHRAEDVLRAYQRYMSRQRTKRVAELSTAISPDIAVELIKDRDAHTEAKTQYFREETEQLQIDCEVLQEQIAGLRNELAETQEESKHSQTTLTEKIDELLITKTELAGEVKSLLGEIRVLRNDRDTARKERSDIEVKLSGLKQTLAVKASDERRARTRAKNLQTRLEETELENKQFRDTNYELNNCLKTSRDQVSSEQTGRTEAENKLLDAEASIDSLKEEIKKLKKRKSPSRASQTPQTDNKQL
jgi:chromosome segregation ATPase